MLRRAAAQSFAAGMFVSIGGMVFLSSENRVVGAVLFTVALLSICYLGCYLFTGKVGYLYNAHGRGELAEILITLAGNLAGTLACGLLAGFAKPALREAAQALCTPKLALAPLNGVILAFFCGVLMYTAVAVYKEKQSPLGILFCVPVFILSGFEHSIADMFYFFAAGWFTPQVFGFLALIVLGNTLGGLFLAWLRGFGEEKGHG